MKDSITKIAMVIALALSSIPHESSAKEVIPAERVLSNGIGAPSHAEVMSSIAGIKDVTEEGRRLYIMLDELAEHDFEYAKLTAEEMRADIIGALAIIELLFQELPDVSIIRSYKKESIEYKLFRAVAEARHGAKNLNDLINQILTISPYRESDINHDALVLLAARGTEVAKKWH